MWDYDCVVIGVGGAGSAALCALARRGLRVLGIERHTPGHDQGSSHGQTRVIRMAYFEHPDYVPLLKEAYALWAELEAHTGHTLFHRTGVLQVGPPTGEIIQGVRRSAVRHRLPVSSLSPDEAASRFPGFRIPHDSVALLEEDAGYLPVEACVRCFAARAEQHGAERWDHTGVRAWRPVDGGVVVATDRGEVTARRLVVAAGSWAGSLLSELSLPLTVLRKPMFWYETTRHKDSPVFLYELPGEGIFYGFPRLGPEGMKVAEHSRGHTIADPSRLRRTILPDERDAVEGFLSRWLPEVEVGAPTRSAVCMYTMTPDGHFVVDTHPLHPQVSVVAGLSGHGFKFTPVLGEILADLVEHGESARPVGLFSIDRLRSGQPR